jgi:hypothetical protein
MTLAKHWLRLGNTMQYLCHMNLAASCDCYVAVSLNRTAPVESDRHRRVAHYSYALQALSVCRDHQAIVMFVVHVVWTYYVLVALVIKCLLYCCCPHGRTHVDARYARACTRVDCGVSSSP